jgi:hypothetical protein
MAREVLFEFTRVGPLIRVAAVDPETRVEVVVQCSASSTEEQLKAAGIARLDYVLRRQSNGPSDLHRRRSAWDGL